MCCDQIIRRNTGALPLCERQNNRKVLRRDASCLFPPIDGDRLHVALCGNLRAGAYSGQGIFDCCIHASNNDYFSHNVKRLNQ